MRYFISIFFLLFSYSIHAQSVETFGSMLPVKLENKWGFIDYSGNVIVDPKYDLIGKPFGRNVYNGSRFGKRYITVLNNDKMGLVHIEGREALPPKFDEVINFSPDSLFTVKNDGKLLVVNELGETVLDGMFDSIVPLNRKYFLVQNDKKWGLFHKEKNYLINPEYTYLEQLKRENRYLKFSKETNYNPEIFGLVDFENNQIFPAHFRSIKIIGNHFLTKKEYYQLWDEEGKKLLEDGIWNKAVIISKSFIKLNSEIDNSTKLFSITQKKFLNLKEDYDQFIGFGDDYLMVRKGRKKGLIDTDGNEIIPAMFSEIEFFSEAENLFKVKQTHWGIYHPEKKLVLPTEYNSIVDTESGFFQIQKRKNYGLIDKNINEVLAVSFSEINIDSTNVKAFQGKRMSLFKIENDNSLTLEDVYPVVYTLKVGYAIDNQIKNINPFGRGRPNPNNSRRRNNRRIKKTPDYSQIENSDFEWFNEWGNWGLRKKSDQSIVYEPQFEYVRKIPFTDLSAVYNYDKRITENHFVKMMTIRPKTGTYGIALFSHSQGKFLNDFDLMGIRVEDMEYDYPIMTCLDKEGKYIFVNKKGKIVQNGKQYIHVGAFSDGRAKVCKSGTLKTFPTPGETTYNYSKSKTEKFVMNVRFDRFIGNSSSDMYMYDGVWGFIDTFGNEVFNENFEYVHDFLEGTSICKKENWGVINVQGQPVLDFKYKAIKNVRDFLQISVGNKKPVFYNKKGNAIVDWGYEQFTSFSEGFCAVRKNGKWGYVNPKGDEVLDCKFLTANPFKNGRASVQDEKGWYWIDTSGIVLLDFTDKSYYGLGNLSEGLCWFKVKNHDKFLYGFLDKNGEMVIPSIYSKAFDFDQGRARVVQNRKTGLIDRNGIMIMKPKKYDLVFPFNEYGVAKVQEDNMGEFGLIDINGKKLSYCKYLKINDFTEGLARVVVAKKGIGFVDTLGNEVIPPIYRAVGEFSDGLVAVQNEHTYQWEYIDVNNQTAFKGEFASASSFQNGIAIVRGMLDEDLTNYVIDKTGKKIERSNNDMVIHFSENKYGHQKFDLNEDGEITQTFSYFTTKDGKKIHPGISYESIEPFENNISVVQSKKRKWGTINGFGYSIIPNKFSRIFKLDNNIYSGISSQLYGLNDRAGNTVLEPVYDYIKIIRNRVIRIEQGSKIGYFTLNGDWLWQMQD